jgi:hypothetical protein
VGGDEDEDRVGGTVGCGGAKSASIDNDTIPH